MDNKLQIFLPETTLTLGTLKEKLLNATNKNDVQTIIKENQIRF